MAKSGMIPALQVWLPVISVNDVASILCLQRMSELHASNVATGTEMEAAAKIADSTTELLLASQREQDQRPKMLLGY